MLVLSVVLLFDWWEIDHVAAQTKIDVYANTRFCDVNGTCGESPTTPTTRTIYSARTFLQYQKWLNYNEQLNEKARVYAEKRRYQGSNSSRPLIFLGDSITEAWMGTSLGTPTERSKGIPDLLQEWMRSSPSKSSPGQHLPFDPLVLGVSGDQTQHLLWRIQNGQLQPMPMILTLSLWYLLGPTIWEQENYLGLQVME